MRRGFTLIECMVAGAVLALVVTAFMRALSVINRVEYENAQYMEADAIVWDAIAEEFNKDYPQLQGEYRQGGKWHDKQFDVTVRKLPAKLTLAFDGTLISARVEWNGQYLSNAVIRSEYAHRRDD